MSFYFTIIDDTDDATYENILPVYNLLYRYKIFITKTIWVYPPKDKTSKGDSLQRLKYLNFIKELKEKGFEIGLHNVGSGDYTRDEILKGIEEFKNKLGEYPKIHVNHSYNKDSIYGGYKRFNLPISALIRKMYKQYSGAFHGEEPKSRYFWGDKHKEIIQFSRNHEFDEINTIKCDPYMPYIDPKRSKYANYWYSATFAPNQWVYNKIVNKKNIERLDKENGACILFTHLGYFMQNGKVDKGFIESLEILSDNENGVYKPVSNVLDEIAEKRVERGDMKYPVINSYAKIKMELFHLFTRVNYRKILKLDDYAFKRLDKNQFIDT